MITHHISRRRKQRGRFRDIQLTNLGVVTGQDAVSNGEAGVGSDHAVAVSGDGHARAAVVLVGVEPRHRLRARDAACFALFPISEFLWRWRERGGRTGEGSALLIFWRVAGVEFILRCKKRERPARTDMGLFGLQLFMGHELGARTAHLTHSFSSFSHLLDRVISWVEVLTVNWKIWNPDHPCHLEFGCSAAKHVSWHTYALTHMNRTAEVSKHNLTRVSVDHSQHYSTTGQSQGVSKHDIQKVPIHLRIQEEASAFSTQIENLARSEIPQQTQTSRPSMILQCPSHLT